MKIFFYMGRNAKTKSGVSWKIWKIDRNSRWVTTWWGPAEVKNRRVVPIGTLRKKPVEHASSEEAARDEERRIRMKLKKGYERTTRVKANG